MHRYKIALATIALFLFIPLSTYALTDSQISAILGLLQSFGADAVVIANVSANLHGTPVPSSPSALACTFARTLYRGLKGDDVSCLQKLLIQENLLSVDSATGFYGALTEAAVQKYQAAHGIVSSGTPETTGYGTVGAKTRAALLQSNPVSSIPTSTGTTPTTSVPGATGGGTGGTVTTPTVPTTPTEPTVPTVPTVPSSGNVTPEQFGAKGDAVTDDTAALQNALSTGKIIHLSSGKSYLIRSRLVVPSGGGITSDNGKGWIVLGTNPGFPDSQVDYGIYLNGVSNVSLTDFGITLQHRDDNGTHAIAMFFSSGVTVRGVEIKSLALGYGILMRSSHDVIIDSNYIHDTYINQVTTCHLVPPSQFPTTTSADGVCGKSIAIKVDSGQTLATYQESYGINITNNRIESLNVGPDFEKLWDYQSEAINIAGPQESDSMPESQLTHDVTISGNIISNVGIGINSYALGTRVTGNTITNAVRFGIELIHGAQGNTVEGNAVSGAGYLGIYLRGDTSGRTLKDNQVIGNTISNTGTNPHTHLRGDWTTGYYGLYCDRGSGNTMTGNSLTGSKTANFYDGCTGSVTDLTTGGGDVTPVIAGSIGEYCAVPNMSKADGAVGGLYYQNGTLSQIGAASVTSCVDADFGSVKSFSKLNLTLALEDNICGDTCSGSYCGTDPGIKIFLSSDKSSWVSEGGLSGETSSFGTIALSTAGTPFRYARICRGPGGAPRSNVAIDAITATP